MVNNRWLTGSLFLGLVIAVTLVSSIPIYTSGVMQKLLIKELEEYQLENHDLPGKFSFTDTFATPVQNPKNAYLQVEAIHNELIKNIDLPILEDNIMMRTSELRVAYEDKERQESEKSQRNGKLVMIPGIQDHITLMDGTFPSEEPDKGVVEVLVSEDALYKRNIVLGTQLIINNQKHNFEYVIKPVGVFQKNSESDSFWFLIPDSLSQDFIVHENYFRNEILDKHEGLLGLGKYNTLFDYYQITESHIPELLSLTEKYENQIESIKWTDISFDFPMIDILESYEEKHKQMTAMLWSLNVPVMIMLAIYLYMISRLIVNRQLNEIAIFSSRGASKLKIWLIYLMEVSILGFIAFLIGPLIGLQLGKMLGATNGFMEFIQRSALPVKLSGKAYFYGFLTVIASIAMVMAPVFKAAGKSIVDHKQQVVRSNSKIQWVFIIFEMTLLGFSIYELIKFNRRQEELLAFDVESADLMIDPILFFLPALFTIGLGLVVLRIYPWILKGIFKLGEKRWSFSLYSTFLQISRSSKQYNFLMIFLVMTIGMGVFSASAARTINVNLEDQLYYKNGAEIRLQQYWPSNISPKPIGPYEYNEPDDIEEEEIVYREPPFDPITKLKQIETTAKVFERDELKVEVGNRKIDYAQLMAIETKDFGEVAWFKNSLIPGNYHWYHYLNLISQEPSAVLVSEQAATALKLEKGDTITLSWPGSNSEEFMVYEIIKYWPTFNPLAKVDEKEEQVGALVVANLPYIQANLGLEPYEVWLNLKPDSIRQEFYEDLQNTEINVTNMSDVLPQVTKLKNSALLLGVNGAMTMGFFISLFISFIGFLLYWILTIKSRTLQYGIYRAMGISMFNITGIMIWEQIFTSGIACVFGIIIGGLTSYLYVPLFKISLGIDQLMPPFVVISDVSDEAKIYMFVAGILLLGSVILISFIRKIKIDQAIKLGED